MQPGSAPLAPMYLHIFGAGPCGATNGNGQEFLRGMGTPTVTLRVTSLVPGVNRIMLNPGFVVGAGGVPSAGVDCFTIDGGLSTEPSLVSAVGDVGAATVTLRFDQPVHPGDAAGLRFYGTDGTCSVETGRGRIATVPADHDTVVVETDAGVVVDGTNHLRLDSGVASSRHDGRPSAATGCTSFQGVQPPALVAISVDRPTRRVSMTFDRAVDYGTAELAPLYLVFHGGDGACGSPMSNGSRFLSGAGSTRITVEASAVPTEGNHFSLASGFVTAAGTGVPNRAVRCDAYA